MEGNCIDDIKELENLDYSQRLTNLNIVGNKINSRISQKLIFEKLPNLLTLNDIPRKVLEETFN